MSLFRPREEVGAKPPYLGRARSNSRSGDSPQAAPYSNSLARPGKFVCFEIVGYEPLAFKYEAVEDEWSHIASNILVDAQVIRFSRRRFSGHGVPRVALPGRVQLAWVA